MRFHEFKEDKWSTLASRTISKYADELGPDSMDYDMLKTASELLDKDMLKQLAQHIEKSDTAPREYVMKKIADHDPETFKKLYGDQEGYLSVMKPVQDLKDAEDNTDRGMNKYGLAARQKDGKFYSYRHGKLTGTFDNIQDLQKHQQELIKDESVKEESEIEQQLGPVAKEVEMFRAKQKELFTTMVDALSQDGTGLYPTPEAEKIATKMLSFNPKDVDHYSPFNKESAVQEDDGELARLKELSGDDKDVEKAKQIAKDKAGDMTGASQDIDKVKKGLTKHPDVADALKTANEELNRITKLAGLGEGASMLPYFKQDEKTWSFPDAWQNDEALDTPYMSNMSMREFLDGLGYDSNFEDASPVDAKEFVAKTTQWLQKNIDNPSKEIPTTIDKSGGGATMIGGGKPEGWMNRQVKHHNELARKILTKYPEVTHFGFN